MICRIFATLLVLTCTARAELFDLTRIVPAATFKTEAQLNLDFDGLTPGHADLWNASIFLRPQPFVFGDSLQWLPTLAYQSSRFHFSARPFPFAPGAPDLEQSLHRVSFGNFLVWQPDDRWLLGAMLTPEIRSAFDHLTSRDFALTAGVGAAYRFDDRFILGFGFYGEDLGSDPWLIAGPAFLWNPNEAWTVSLLGPVFNLRRHFSERSSLALETAWNGGFWAMESFGQPAKLEFNSLRAGLVWRQRLTETLSLEAAAGVTFGNRLRVLSAGGRDLFPGLMGRTGAAPYVRLGLSLSSW